MKKYNVTRAKKFIGKDGNEKNFWLPVGTITQFDNGNMILELNFLEGKFNIFEQKPKTDNPSF